MASKTTATGAAALRYATALIDIAVESKLIEKVERDLNDLQAMIASSEELRMMINSPLLKKADQKRALLALAEKAGFHELTRNFLSVVVDNRRLRLLPGIIGAVQTDIARRRGEVAVNVQSAFALSDSQFKSLQGALSQATGQEANLNVEINRDLIGGMIVTIGSRMIDDSVKRKLERLKRAMQSQSNQNMSKQEEVR